MKTTRMLTCLVLFAAACGHELDGPTPAVSSVTPSLICNEVITTITLGGSGFSPLAQDALTGDPKLALPSVTLQRILDLEGNPVADPAITLCGDVTDPSCTRVRWLSQTDLQIEIDPNLMLQPGTFQITVTNANGNSVVSTVPLDVVSPPELFGIEPTSLCPSGGQVVINGSDFADGATVTIGGQDVTVDSVTPTQIMGTLGPGLMAGTYDVVVDNGAGCVTVLPDAFTIVQGPLVYFVDPPVAYNGIAVQATVYVSGVDAAPASVGIRPTGTMDPLTELDHTWDPAHANRILATIPSGLTAGGYDVVVASDVCDATLVNGVTVAAQLTVAVAGIDPTFGWTNSDTAMTITAIDPPPAGMVGFQPTPRAYLNPDVAGPTTVASQLMGVVWSDAARMTAIVPQGLPAGLYDLIVINPDGSVGLLDQAFTVTDAASPPPTITNITPGSVVNDPGQAVTIEGSGFRMPSVQATCQEDGGGLVIVDGTGVVSTDTIIDVTFDMGPLTPAVCVIRVTNDDGTFGDFSALAVTLPSQNIPATVSDDVMTVARRALAATAGRVTQQARYLYAIGGDDGSGTMLLDSVESAPVDLFGRLGAWSPQRSPLPAPRNHAGAVTIGRFIYLVGGSTTTGITDSVLRAQILDPLAAPEIDDLIFEYVTDGIAPGLYYYRVSAVMDPADPSNPGGETLPSDPFTVIVPPVMNQEVKLSISWTPIAGAVAYRVYRTPGPGLLLDDIRRVAEVATTTYVDDDTAVAGTETPLPEASLGAWHEVGPLAVPRAAAGVTFAPDPDAADAFFLYAIGGLTLGVSTLDSYDLARVVIAADGSQTVEPFTNHPGFLTAARWQLSAVAMGHERASRVAPGDTWIYAMPGLNAATSSVFSDVTAGLVGADGTLGMVTEVDSVSSGTGGYAVVGANNFLYIFGGAGGGGNVTASAQSSEMCTASVGGCTGEPPELRNWNALGFGLLQARYLPGTTLESAFIFIVGGASDTAPATATTERTHW